jgi:predicted PurR-regulated permease PerM
VPLIGPIIVAVPVVLVAFLQSPSLALFALLLYIALQQIEGQLLTPLIMRQQTDVPQTLVIFAVVAGGAIGGLLGVLVSIPLAAALRVFALEVVVPVVRRWTGADANPPLPGLDGAAAPP